MGTTQISEKYTFLYDELAIFVFHNVIPLLSVCNCLFLVKRPIRGLQLVKDKLSFPRNAFWEICNDVVRVALHHCQNNTKYKSPAREKSPLKTLSAVDFYAETHRIVPCSLLEALRDVQSWAFCYALSLVL